MDIKIYDIVFDNENPDDLFLCNSLVTDAAVEVDFMAFKQQSTEDKEKLFTFEKSELEHKIFGVAIRADFPIYRIDNFGREYFVRFSKETIEQLVLKYSKENNFNLVSLQHDGNLVEGVNLVELFIKDTDKNINPKGFEHIENGSLFCTYKVENPDVWEKIQNGEIKGFSIEIICDIEPTNESIELSKQQPEETDINSFIDDLYKYLVGEGIDSNEIEILFADSKKKVIEKALKDKEHIAIKTEGKSKTINGWIYANVDGTLYVWDNKEFHIINTKNIDTIKITQTNILPNWNVAEQHPMFPQVREAVEKSDNITDIGSVDNNLIYDSIFNHKIVMLRYNDEQNKPCLDYRQVLICEYGTTRKGNRAIRAYEYSGSTHHPEEIPGWRTLLINRILDIKSTPEGLFKPITQAPPKFNPNPIKDRDNFTVIWKSVF